MTNEPGAKFCPECGGTLSEQSAPKKEKIDHDVLTNCPACREPILNRKSKYCLNCGVALDGSQPNPGPTYAPPIEESYNDQSIAYPPIETTRWIDKPYIKSCVKLFHLPHGVLMEGASEYGGEVILTTDGVAFYTKKMQSFLIPFAAIASVNQGYKKNLLDIHLVNEDIKHFRLMNAFDWVLRIRDRMSQ
jgi:hypothetical protein